MAIMYICRECKGKGQTKQKLWLVTRIVTCKDCSGVGKKKYTIQRAQPVSK
ncbi:hypothetical protein [Alkalicoccus luteus]|uniref:Uncharacterized protein n=1 Tax=Alkalicoccus luteus TaxID=1237094 RepID=A0A969PNR6_9BACI|nr:hypothetical protein [Alkalicoccus luteus]NJP36658.1 hypothetical protein [Alkalicoccus luteus]